MKNDQNNAKIKVGIAILAAFLLFSFLFATSIMNFWLQMSVTVIALCFLAYLLDRHGFKQILKEETSQSTLKTIAIGLGSAVALYFVFFVGNIAASWIRGGTENIADVYTLKHDNPVWMMTLVIALIVGPGEELFWRGYVQRSISGKAGNMAGLLISSACYCIAHLASSNFMLLAAALICGLFWGALYWKFKNIYINIISHVAWDLMVFIFFPFN
ncbi:hypothetical protein BVX94_01790 [bacterium B17]|nr:hypothetical protein BVX94_01790 [bacterium B17]